MRIIATRKAHQNRRTIDPWTAVHLSAGLAFGLIGAPLRWGLAGAVTYEIAEQVFERFDFGKAFFRTSGPEVVPNAVFDVVVFAAGYWLGRKWNET